ERAMAELKFYCDTHVARQIAVQLRRRGVDIVRCQEVDMADADDETLLRYAAREGRAFITFDKGFIERGYRWLTEGRGHGGIFLCQERLEGPGGIGTIVEECVFYWEAVQAGAVEMDEIRNTVIFVK
ncbi:MAG: DUF5615 family PIN-like protein, partial [Anaerolineae bacterium]|nr:DUF5615 family PIN-like protein [Anaerolineae bacterium]